MVTVLAVPDGAAEPLGEPLTCLERAATPTLDGLLARGVLQRLATIPDGLPAGTEVGLPALLGVERGAPLPRGQVEAAAAGVVVAPGEGAWRLDLVPPRAVDGGVLARLRDALGVLGGRVHPLAGHRCLLVGPAVWGDAPAGPHQAAVALEAMATGPFAAVVTATDAALAGTGVRAWPWGALSAEVPAVPALLGRPVTVVTGGGPASGIARLLGCDLTSRPAAQVVEHAPAGSIVVLHDPAPDEAAHARDRAGKIAAIERFDRELLAPVVEVLEQRGGRLVVSPDHGCDPATGRHSADPVPALLWRAGSRPGGGPRLTERDAAALRPVAASLLLSAPSQVAGWAA